MLLKSVSIKNFKSLKDVTVPIDIVDGSYTFALIGINESGKSSLLRAMYLKEGIEGPAIQDFVETNPITINYEYGLFKDELKLIQDLMISKGFSETSMDRINILSLNLVITYEYQEPTTAKRTIILELNKDFLKGYIREGDGVLSSTDGGDAEINVKEFMEEKLITTFYDLSHKAVLWSPDPKYLISEPINLDEFASNPQNVSIPLYNCFLLSGITNIGEQITKIKGNPAETKNLTERLQDSVTAHVQDVWPDHPITIKFNIDGSLLGFLVEDVNVRYKTKTTLQRSDGFRQFISFLLTISAQNRNDELSRTLILLDEPETHLHPTGQESLLEELIDITQSDLNNIVFFATHSNFLIDKKNLNRCFRVSKEDNENTVVKRLDETQTTYSEVNYIVFNIPTNDYHNELYGWIEENNRAKLGSLSNTKTWFNSQKNASEQVSLQTYIRHSIHHPENHKNKPFTKTELLQSIRILRKLKYGFQ